MYDSFKMRHSECSSLGRFTTQFSSVKISTWAALLKNDAQCSWCVWSVTFVVMLVFVAKYFTGKALKFYHKILLKQLRNVQVKIAINHLITLSFIKTETDISFFTKKYLFFFHRKKFDVLELTIINPCLLSQNLLTNQEQKKKQQKKYLRINHFVNHLETFVDLTETVSSSSDVFFPRFFLILCLSEKNSLECLPLTMNWHAWRK